MTRGAGAAAMSAAAAAAASAQAPRKWEGLVDEALEREVLGTCLDQAPERRRIREAFKNVQLSIDHCLFKEQYIGIGTKEDKPRLRTALEMLKTTQEIERRLEEVSLPLIILHGEADLVTDPAVSKVLYEKARSQDKKLCLYKGAYHAILEGEPDETIFQVLDDIISWLDQHSTREEEGMPS